MIIDLSRNLNVSDLQRYLNNKGNVAENARARGVFPCMTSCMITDKYRTLAIYSKVGPLLPVVNTIRISLEIKHTDEAEVLTGT